VQYSSRLNVSSTELQEKPSPSRIQIVPLTGLPEIVPGDDLAQLLVKAVRRQRLVPKPGDIFVVAQKIVSKAEGRIVRLDSIKPSERAERWAAEYQKDPRVIEMVLREASSIVRMERGILIVRTHHGFVCANAGVDVSNVPAGTASLLPENPDRSARSLQQQLTRTFGVHVAVIISDTFGRAWRQGLVNVALGLAGIAPLVDYRGLHDIHGKTLRVSVIALADELAAASGLVMGKLNQIPAVVFQGVSTPKGTGEGLDLIRPIEKDLFR
jgi:coenzyme F420-0:L-glutamate ligase / coenzyme F420-1:gamma-L-glutamate ligase